MHRSRILRRGLTSAITLSSATVVVLACALPSAAFDPNDPGLWKTPDFESLMDFVPGRVESFNDGAHEGGKSTASADTESLRRAAAAAFAGPAIPPRADADAGTDEVIGADSTKGTDADQSEIVTMSRNGVVVIDTPAEWRSRGSYRHHAFRPERQPALGYRHHSNGWFSTGPERAPSARGGYDEYGAADEAGDYGWPNDPGSVGANDYGRVSGSYPYSYGTDPGRPGQSILSRGWDWQDVEQDWDVDDGN